jgi:hypothetical protein
MDEVKFLPPGVSLRLTKYGNYYAKIPEIVADIHSEDRCSLLRAILNDDLRCGKIFEVEGEGGTWWDFRYKDCKFTCDLLISKCGGSELYPTSCTASKPSERDLLDELAVKIVTFARERQAQS